MRQNYSTKYKKMGKLSFLTNPASVAVIGASPNAGKVGNTVVTNIKESGYTGKVYPINPTATEILGYKTYKSVLDVPDSIDVVIVVIPSKAVLAAAKECAQKKVKSLVVITAGFKEIGGEGVQMEQDLTKICKDAGIRLVGPNCLGIVTPNLNCTFASAKPSKGSIAFLSQSGAMLTSILDWALTNGIGFSNFISLGNKADVDEVDLIMEVAEDPNTDIILLYLESIVDGRKFLEQIPTCVHKKPVIILKSGTSAAGAAAASSHTGALAGNDIAFDLAFEKAGVLRAATMSDLFDLGRLFVSHRLPKGDNFVIVTNAGGPGIVTTDAFETYHVGMAALSDKTKEALAKVLPGEASVKNPVDIVGDAPPKRYEDALEICFKEPPETVAGAVILVTPQGQTKPCEVAELCTRMYAKYPDRLVVSAFMGGLTMQEPSKILNNAKMPVFPFPEPAIHATGAVLKYRKIKNRKTLAEKKVEVFKVDNERIKKIIAGARADGRTVLLSHETSEIFTLYGVNAPKTKLATNEAEAATFAKEVTFPVVMKIVSPQIIHKSDCGGVKLNIKTEAEATAAFKEIMANAAKNGPKGAVLKGVEIQQMVDFSKYQKTTEMIVGVNRDPTWGPMIMIGQGGIYANYIKDVAFDLAYKYDREDAEAQLKKTKIYEILNGVRGQPRSDIKGLLDTMVKLAQLVNDFSEITELDMNPLLVFEEQKEGKNPGIAAVDVKITLSH